MDNPFREMTCYLLAGDRERGDHFATEGDVTRLERSYRRYAKLFERVVLVIKPDQATDWYLNYPHVCDETTDRHPVAGVEAALRSDNSEAVFVGSADIDEFPLDLAVNLVRNYRGEAFLGYRSNDDNSRPQPWFGIYATSLVDHLGNPEQNGSKIPSIIESKGRLLDLPADVPATAIGLT